MPRLALLFLAASLASCLKSTLECPAGQSVCGETCLVDDATFCAEQGPVCGKVTRLTACGERAVDCGPCGAKPPCGLGTGNDCEPLCVDGVCAIAPRFGNIHDVDGRADDDVWAVGSLGNALHWNGTQWRRVHTGTSHTLTAVRMVGSEVWATGICDVTNKMACPGATLRLDGNAWNSVGPAESSPAGWALWGASPQDAVVIDLSADAHHWDGSQWTTRTLASNLGRSARSRLWGTSGRDVWALVPPNNSAPRLFHFDGTRWSEHALPAPLPGVFTAGFAGEAGNLWLGIGDRLLRWDGATWDSWPAPVSPVTAIATHSSGIQVLGGGRIAQRQGQPPTWNTLAGTTQNQRLWTSPSGEHWTAFTGLTRIAGGIVTAYSDLDQTPSAHECLGLGGQFWCPGSKTFHWDGERWEQLDIPSSALSGTAPDDVWAVGPIGSVAHFDGTRWQKVSANTTEDLWGVHAVSPDVNWVYGENGTVLRRTGTTWTRMETGHPSVSGVVGKSATSAWMISAGALFEYDGAGWTQRSLPWTAPTTAYSLFPAPGNTVWVSNSKGDLALWDGTWTTFDTLAGVLTPCSPDGSLLGAASGVFERSGAELKQVVPPLLDWVDACSYDENGDLWALSLGQVFRKSHGWR